MTQLCELTANFGGNLALKKCKKFKIISIGSIKASVLIIHHPSKIMLKLIFMRFYVMIESQKF